MLSALDKADVCGGDVYKRQIEDGDVYVTQGIAQSFSSEYDEIGRAHV